MKSPDISYAILVSRDSKHEYIGKRRKLSVPVEIENVFVHSFLSFSCRTVICESYFSNVVIVYW